MNSISDEYISMYVRNQTDTVSTNDINVGDYTDDYVGIIEENWQKYDSSDLIKNIITES